MHDKFPAEISIVGGPYRPPLANRLFESRRKHSEADRLRSMNATSLERPAVHPGAVQGLR